MFHWHSLTQVDLAEIGLRPDIRSLRRPGGAVMVPESLDWAGFAGDADVAVRSGEDEGGQGLGDRDVGRRARRSRGE
jgi:hypothetical protein